MERTAVGTPAWRPSPYDQVGDRRKLDEAQRGSGHPGAECPSGSEAHAALDTDTANPHYSSTRAKRQGESKVGAGVII